LRLPLTTWFGSETSRRTRLERPAIGAENPIQIRRGWRSASRTSISSVLRPTGRVENNNAAVSCFFSSLLALSADYPYRVRLPRAVFREVVAAIARDVSYFNVKDEVVHTRGAAYYDVLNSVWATLRRLEDAEARAPAGKVERLWPRRR
jgi:hypothetical protein